MSVFESFTHQIGEQISNGYKVQLYWSFPNGVSYNGAQIYRQGATVPVGQVWNDERSCDVVLYPSDYNLLTIYARDYSGGVFRDRTHLPGGGDDYAGNSIFTAQQAVTLPAPPPSPPADPDAPHRPAAPIITSLTSFDGGVAVEWRKGDGKDVDRWVIATVENGVHLKPRVAKDTARQLTISPVKASATYDIGVRAENDYRPVVTLGFVEKTAQSEWSWSRIVIPENMGWPPSGKWQTYDFTSYTDEPNPGSDLAAVSRSSDKMDVFWFLQNEHPKSPKAIRHAWLGQNGWLKEDLPGWAAYGGCMTVVSRQSDTMELFYSGLRGTLETRYYYDASGWSHGELGPAGSVNTDAQMASVSRHAETMEIWWVSPDGSVKGAYWYGNERVWHTYTLAGPGSASRDAGLCAVSRHKDTLEVFWVAPDRSIGHAYWYEGHDWVRGRLADPGSVAPGSRLSAISRKRDTMEVFWIGSDLSVRNAWWYEWGDWGKGLVAPAGCGARSISVCSRAEGHMEVFFTSITDSFGHAWYYDGGTWGWEWIHNRLMLGATENTIVSLSRAPNTMEAWHVKANGLIECSFIYFK